MRGDQVDDITALAGLVAAFGIRIVRVPDLEYASILLPVERIAIVDTNIRPGEWRDLVDAVLDSAEIVGAEAQS